MKEYNDYQKEQNKLLMDFLLNKERRENSVEFIISPYCNQSCEYCYLYKHGDELYPKEIRDFNTIKENFKILIKWLDEQKFNFETYDIFSGEFFNLPIWEDIFQIIYDYEKSLNERKRNAISVPTNGSFLINNKQVEKVDKWIDKFKQDLNMDIHISFSVEGPESLEKIERPLKNSQIKNDENFYKNFFDFRKRHKIAAHPMVTKNFVKNYKENYDWWIDTLFEYDLTCMNHRTNEIVYSVPMFLEVRDAEQWDEESLSNYKKFLKYVAKKDFATIFENNIDEFGCRFFDNNIDTNFNKVGKYFRTQPYIINYPYLVDKMPCSIQGGAVFRLGDLAYVPCHRTCYPHFIYGHLIKEDGKIIGIEANKPTLAIKIKNLNPNRQVLKCADCPIRTFCLKGCLGSQYEHTNELFCADERLCDMFYTKYKTIHEIAEEYNLYDWLKQSSLFTPRRKEFIDYVRKTIIEL